MFGSSVTCSKNDGIPNLLSVGQEYVVHQFMPKGKRAPTGPYYQVLTDMGTVESIHADYFEEPQ